LGPVCGQFREGAQLCVGVVKNLSRSAGELFKSIKGNCLKVSKNSPPRKGGAIFNRQPTQPDAARIRFFPSPPGDCLPMHLPGFLWILAETAPTPSAPMPPLATRFPRKNSAATFARTHGLRPVSDPPAMAKFGFRLPINPA